MALSAEGVSLTLGGRSIVDAVSASLQPGEVTAVLGPNGAGKSSLLKLLAGLLRPSAGRVTLDGDEIAQLAPDERAAAIGYLPQDATVHWNVAVRELVALGPPRRRGFGLGPSERAAVEAALAETDTLDLADRPIATLSGGERARVLLARVLAGRPRWLLADEPLASLDPAHQLDLADRLRGVAGQGSGVVVVLHDLAIAGRIADNVLLMQRGRLAAAGPVAEVLTAERLANVFGVQTAALDPAAPHIRVPVARLA